MALQNLLVLAVLWWQPCGLLVWLFCFTEAFLMNESMQKNKLKTTNAYARAL
jgi:hypothetical protein